MRRYFYQSKLLRTFIGAGDALGKPVGFLLKSKKLSRVVRSLAVIHLNSLGDVVMSTPLLELLRQRYPAAKISYVCTPAAAPLLRCHPAVDEVFVTDGAGWYGRDRQFTHPLWRLYRWLCRRRPEIVYELKGDPLLIALMAVAGIKYRVGFAAGGLGWLLHQSVSYDFGLHHAENLLHLLGAFSPSPEDLRYKLPIPNISSKTAPYVVIHPRAGYQSKLWLDERWEEVVKYLLERKYQVAIVGGSDVNKITSDLISKFGSGVRRVSASLTVSMEVIAGARALIGLDSVMAHIGAAYDVPTVVLFSPVNDPRRWRPLGGRVVTLTPPGAPCRGTEARVCLHQPSCMSKLTTATVIGAINQWI